MTWDDDFMCQANDIFSEMRLLAEGAVILFEEAAGVLHRLALEAEKDTAVIALNDIGTALYALRRLVTHLQDASRQAELHQHVDEKPGLTQ